MNIRTLWLAGALLLSGAAFGAETAETEKPVEVTETTEKTAPQQTESSAAAVPDGDGKTESTNNTAPTEKAAPPETPTETDSGKPRIAVFPFTTIDIQGQHFRDFTDRTVPVTPQNSLNESELNTVDEVMLGYVKLVDAEEERARRAHDRARLDAENDRDLARQNELAEKLLNTHQRAVVIGAAFMEAALGNYDSVELVDRGEIYKAYRDMSARQAGGLPRPLPEVLQLQGATHVLYGTVADLRVAGNEYSGYGINTKSFFYELDVMIKIADLKTNRIVFSGVFTGQSREFYLDRQEAIIDSGRFETLMKSAVAQAAQAIDKKFDPQVSK